MNCNDVMGHHVALSIFETNESAWGAAGVKSDKAVPTFGST